MKFSNLLLLISEFSLILGDSIQSSSQIDFEENSKTNKTVSKDDTNEIDSKENDKIINDDNKITLSDLDIQYSEDAKVDNGEYKEFCLYTNNNMIKVVNPSFTDSNNSTVYFNSIEEYAKFIGPTWYGVGYCGNDTIVNNVGIYYKVQVIDKSESHKNKKNDNTKGKRDNENESQESTLPKDKVNDQGVPDLDTLKKQFESMYKDVISDGLQCIPLSSINPAYNPYHPALINIKLSPDKLGHNVVNVLGLPYGGTGKEVKKGDIKEKKDKELEIGQCGIVNGLGGSTLSCTVKISKNISNSLSIGDSNTESYHESYGKVISQGNSLTNNINNLIQLSSALTNSKSISFNQNKGESSAIENVLNIIRTQSSSQTKD